MVAINRLVYFRFSRQDELYDMPNHFERLDNIYWRIDQWYGNNHDKGH